MLLNFEFENQTNEHNNFKTEIWEEIEHQHFESWTPTIALPILRIKNETQLHNAIRNAAMRLFRFPLSGFCCFRVYDFFFVRLLIFDVPIYNFRLQLPLFRCPSRSARIGGAHRSGARPWVRMGSYHEWVVPILATGIAITNGYHQFWQLGWQPLRISAITNGWH